MATTATGVTVPATPYRSRLAGRHRPLIEPGLSPRTFAAIRWTQISGQTMVVLAVVAGLGLPLPLVPLLSAIGLSAVITLWAQRRLIGPRRLTEAQLGLILVFDALQIAFLLSLTGALANPFNLFLLFPAIIAATTAGVGWCAAVCATVVAAASLLAVLTGPVPWTAVPEEALPLHVAGSWVAISFGSVLAASYAWRIADEARRTARALSATQLALEREQQLTHLDGLATAAAHDLGTPLSTISVLARELLHQLPPGNPGAEDAAALHAQARRCREILARFTRDAPRRATIGQPEVPLSMVLERLRAEYANHDVALNLDVDVEDGALELTVPMAGEVRHALSNLLDNAMNHARAQVAVELVQQADTTQLTVRDDGPGFPPDVLAAIGEPFISTRRGSQTHGLGLFIACTFLTRAGAELSFDNESNGAVVRITWARSGNNG